MLLSLNVMDGQVLGVVIRNHLGSVLLSSWRAEDVEARACYGVRLATEWDNGRTILESDCVLIKTTQPSPPRQGAPVQRKAGNPCIGGIE
jgi:hypothetical protein